MNSRSPEPGPQVPGAQTPGRQTPVRQMPGAQTPVPRVPGSQVPGSRDDRIERAVVVHGYGASPRSHWFDWLAARLDGEGVRAAIPQLPRSEAPDSRAWLDTLAGAVGVPDERTAIVAHSLGCLTTLAYLSRAAAVPAPPADSGQRAQPRPPEQQARPDQPDQPDQKAQPWRLGSLVLVAGFVDRLPAIPELDGFVDALAGGAGLDLALIRDRTARITVIRSDDDTRVPPPHSARLAELLGAREVVVPGARHFRADEGATLLPEALAALGFTAPPSAAPPSAAR